MEITLINRTNTPAEEYAEDLKRVSVSCEKVLKLKKTYEVSVTFVRSRTMRTVNREYRGIDRPTDVISFAIQDDDAMFAEEMNDLGDIFINIDYARRQAKEYGHSERREVLFLFTHGLLHCLGYDHMEAEEEAVMFELQDRILDPIVRRK